MDTELLEALECLKSWLKIKDFELDLGNSDIEAIPSTYGSCY
jgi:hypothetical protein